MSKKEEKIEEIEEFEIGNKNISKIIKQEKPNETLVRAFEEAFEKYRIYGDERDIKSFKIKEQAITGLPCMIQRVSAFFSPRNLVLFDNQMIISHDVMEDIIDKFKEYRKTHDKIPFDIKRGFKPEIDDD